MPAKTIKRRLTEAGGATWPTMTALASRPWPSWSTVLQRAIPQSRDLELKEDALRLGSELLRGTKYEEER
jgi:hypothetical protein